MLLRRVVAPPMMGFSRWLDDRRLFETRVGAESMRHFITYLGHYYDAFRQLGRYSAAGRRHRAL